MPENEAVPEHEKPNDAVLTDEAAYWRNLAMRSIAEANRHAAKVERRREAITEALKSHVYTFPSPDEDGNIARAEKVERILREALNA